MGGIIVGKKNSNGLIVILIVVVLILYAIIEAIKAVISFITSLFSSIITMLIDFFLFIYNNPVTVCLGVLIIVFLCILIRQICMKQSITQPKLIKTQKIKHPLYNIILSVLKYNSSVINDHQQFRGLIKDYANGENNIEINIFFDILDVDIPSYMMKLSGLKYHSKIINIIYNKYFRNSKNKYDYKNCLSMLLDVLNEIKLLNIILREDSEMPLNKMVFFIKRYYRVLFPSLLLISSTILFVFSISHKWKISEKMVSIKHEQQLEQIVMTYAFVNSSVLNMRVGPSAESSIVTQLHKNDKVEILSLANDSWLLVSFDRYKGYVNSTYLSNIVTEFQEYQNQEIKRRK
jgi:hypothetical protein